MEPENHPLEKENTSSKSSFLGSMLVFGGVSISIINYINWCFTARRKFLRHGKKGPRHRILMGSYMGCTLSQPSGENPVSFFLEGDDEYPP